MIDLRCCTLVTPIYNRSKEDLNQAVRVVNYMKSVGNFGHAILFSACEVTEAVSAEVVQIPETDIRGLQIFQMKVMPRFIRTPFVMIVHTDGFVISPALWTNDFLQYDFIGAPWSDAVIGNDGFSLQSQKMLWAKESLPFVDTIQGDEYACRVNRIRMLNSGVQFAPFGLAMKFSTETIGNEYPSFGYHGKNASPDKHKKGWETIAAFEAGDAPTAPDPAPS